MSCRLDKSFKQSKGFSFFLTSHGNAQFQGVGNVTLPFFSKDPMAMLSFKVSERLTGVFFCKYTMARRWLVRKGVRKVTTTLLANRTNAKFFPSPRWHCSVSRCRKFYLALFLLNIRRECCVLIEYGDRKKFCICPVCQKVPWHCSVSGGVGGRLGLS